MCINDWTRRDLFRNAAVVGAAAVGVHTLAAPPVSAKERRFLFGEKIALTNVRVFDGTALSAPRTVVIDNGLIGISALGARTVDCGGATLLPGLIDAHVHLENLGTLEQLTGYGVTTGLDMATFPASVVRSLRRQPGLTDIRSACTPAVAPGSLQSQIPGFPANGVVTGPDKAVQFVTARVAEGADYIKIIVDNPGLDQATVTALTKTAHLFGKQVMGHATSAAMVESALTAGIDLIHHVPLDTAISAATAARYAAKARVAVPTLGMMKGFTQLGIPGMNYEAARGSVAALRQAGVRILAGSDANNKPNIPVRPAFGLSLHQELELLVEAGLTPAEALRSATDLPALSFGLRDRGVIKPGYRADLVLVDGDPLADIRRTRDIQRVWVGGVEHSA
ncbi:amidohydrolase family protein [Actinocorallia sp. A-T 12471]|uniref:amidohydrolase family protein n=1 Tax=Actinocorallia sp. A-T 12471 TaxID=3089813 RepID=UPI0029D1D94E|nr:amidohydrolase family protein [Actinocorallia sp. A-T 12471]MDX6744175.1 amidohydrolase family protein [Actinocorallia sp. A-T 12471]